MQQQRKGFGESGTLSAALCLHTVEVFMLWTIFAMLLFRRWRLGLRSVLCPGAGSYACGHTPQ